ncbi:MAG TPA: folylpolyglutamate synthase/dihydrofolate synthase family protein [Balneolaceae bacterium]|nr:folylpolyglutamate synthase/dihydrofolate synthase family protein [Balneolaceae bacterium]
MNKNDQLLADIEQKLSTIPMFSKKGAGAANFDLSGMRRFCNLMGNPQNNFPSVHVAGTNGKGTTCRMLASIYHEAGYRVGLYTSPHLSDVRERFLVDGNMIDPSELNVFLDAYWRIIKEQKFTYFEITTAIAFWYFSRSNVDIAIIETGLGGRLDATNVIHPYASVITSIGLDHTDILGNTIAEIAKEKAGIIKKNVPVVAGSLPAEAVQVTKAVADKENAPYYQADSILESFQNNTLKITSSAGEIVDLIIHSGKQTDAKNALAAITVTNILQTHFPVIPEAVKNGVENVNQHYPGKGVFYRLSENKSWYFDGAHNRDSVQELTDHLIRMATPEQWTVVLSFMSDKLNADIAHYWNQFSNIWLYSQSSERAASIEQMKEYFPQSRVLNLSDKNGLPEFKTELVIFSGSFYFYSILSDWMGSGTASDK